jgi:aminopeptidase N
MARANCLKSRSIFISLCCGVWYEKSRPTGRPEQLHYSPLGSVLQAGLILERDLDSPTAISPEHIRAKIIRMSKDVTRLFRQFEPEHYNLELSPDADSMTFSGRVIVKGKKTGRPSQRLTLHQKDLKIGKVTIIKHDRKGDQRITPNRVNLQKSYDEVRLHSNAMLYPGTYTIEIEFSGLITRQMNGLYPCFFEEDGKEKKLLATQFESHHAREVFPCIDEPEAKATFDLTLTTTKGQTVLANTPLESSKTSSKHQVTKFQTTPIMSVYLLAFIIGDLKYLEAKTKDGVLVRTYSTPANVELNHFALDVAVKCLEFYNDYFDLPYPLPKCDLIALPDFASGAMENWGCITFREQCMFVDPKNTSLHTKQYVAMVVAHELAHQWFGNLVTMRWWTDLWLNEGFASWIEYLAIDKLFPQWQMWTQFITDEQQGAMRLDGLDNTHAIEVPVKHPDEIRSIFDTISYGKGASVIHMLHEYLGATAFRNGLRHYLKLHAYKNTDTVDLWQALAEISKQPVKEFMDIWTSQPGFPIVQAKFNDKGLQATQARYYTNPSQDKRAKTLWQIPTNAPLQPVLFTKQEQSWTLEPSSVPVKLNNGQGGFYRVAYPHDYLVKLAKEIPKGKLRPLDRLGLLSDASEAAKAGYSQTADVLELLQYYRNEADNAVWDVMAGTLNTIRGIMDDDSLRQSMKPYVRELVAKQFKRLGWKAQKDEPYFDSLLRPTILGLSAISDDKAVVKECLDRFNKMKQPEDIDPDLRGLIYTTAARHGDVKTFKKLLLLHNSTTLSEERTTLAAALTGFQQPELIKQALELITTDKVRFQDVGYWVAYSFMNRHSKQMTWDWLVTHWDWLSINLGSDLSFPRFPIYAARAFSDIKFLDKYQKFFEPLLNPAMERAYYQGIETIQWQSAWKKRDLKAIQSFFK